MSLPAGIHKRTVVLNPSGVDGSATANYLLNLQRPGFIRAISVVYTNQAATTTLTIKAENSSGQTLFASGATATNIGPAPLAFTGVNQANAAVTVTSVAAGGAPFEKSLNFAVAASNNSVNGAKSIVVKLWLEY